ncbi:hypothetical protein T4B_6836 [Trichinella pseudospiralis]|uniref:Uncharacterized protein n=1 Tax=Trichinella pseudospiralis TaxID=6337 RepID=A0A0V0XKT5_TRIPS|nr:hypothetical protein T4E_5433 [Trichinella pseudospiralis]KRZ20133.1 hypothetical protein T4B_6836 [Trichinella pseudospiralis]
MERHTLIHTHARATDAQGPGEHTTRGDVGGRRLDDMPSQCCHLPASIALLAKIQSTKLENP